MWPVISMNGGMANHNGTPQRTQQYSLPFRTSPMTKHTRLFSTSKRSKPSPLFTQTITPSDSDEETSPFSHPQSTMQQRENFAWAPVQHASRDVDIDMDMDMSDSQTLPSPRSIDQPPTPSDHDRYETSMLSPGLMCSPKPSPRTLISCQVDAFILSETVDAGRLPTPIYGHFPQSAPSLAPVEASLPPITTSFPAQQSQLQSDADIEYEQYLRSRRLPSPISEDEAMEFPARPSAITTPADHQTLPYTPSSSPNGESERDRFYNEHISPLRLRTPARMAQPLVGGKSGSGGGGKIMFSMGFRADCEMCRNRVPGHSNHIFRA